VDDCQSTYLKKFEKQNHVRYVEDIFSGGKTDYFKLGITKSAVSKIISVCKWLYIANPDGL
jgi:hypothetical protein